MRSGTVTDDRLRWDVEAQAISGRRHADEYRRRLAGQPVLPLLRALSARVAAAIP